MRFFAIYSAMLRDGPTLAADDRAFGAWARLATRAAEIEDRVERDGVDWGRIRGAAVWGDRQLIAATSTDKSGVDAAKAAGLVVVDGEDLLVWGYDSAGQKAVDTKRKNGASGGRPKNQQRTECKPNENLPVSESEPEHNPSITPLLSSPLPPSPLLSGGECDEPATRTVEPPPAKTASPRETPTAPPSQRPRGEKAHLRFMQPLQDAFRALCFAEKVTPPRASPAQWGDACQAIQDALDASVFGDADSAIAELSKNLLAAVQDGGKLSFALRDVTLGSVDKAHPKFPPGCYGDPTPW